MEKLGIFHSLLAAEQYKRRNLGLIDVVALKRRWFKQKLLSVAAHFHRSEIKSGLHNLKVVITCLESDETHFDELEITLNHLIYLKVCFVAACTMAIPFIKTSSNYQENLRELHYIEDQYKSVLNLLLMIDNSSHNHQIPKNGHYNKQQIQKKTSKPSGRFAPKIITKSVAIQTVEKEKPLLRDTSIQTNSKERALDQKILNHLVEIQNKITANNKKDTEIQKLNNKLLEANNCIKNNTIDKKELNQIQSLHTMKDNMLKEAYKELKIERDKYVQLSLKLHNEVSKKRHMQLQLFNKAEVQLVNKISCLKEIIQISQANKILTYNLKLLLSEHSSKLQTLRNEKAKLENSDVGRDQDWYRNLNDFFFDDRFERFIHSNLIRALRLLYDKQNKNGPTTSVESEETTTEPQDEPSNVIIISKENIDPPDESRPSTSSDSMEETGVPEVLYPERILIKALPNNNEDSWSCSAGPSKSSESESDQPKKSKVKLKKWNNIFQNNDNLQFIFDCDYNLMADTEEEAAGAKGKTYKNFVKEQYLYDYLKARLKVVDEDKLLKAFDSVREARNSTFLTMKKEKVLEDIRNALQWQLLAEKQEMEEVEGASCLELPHNSTDLEENSCIICFETMSLKNSRVLTCNHTFHSKCIKRWLKDKNQCPICRVEIGVSNPSFLPSREAFPPLGRR